MHNNPNTQSHQSYEENASTELLIGALLFEVVSCNQEQGAVGEAQETNEQRFENTAMEDRKIDQAEFITQAASSNMLESSRDS
ncbi:hypothetical protein [Pontibacter pamirensis]|uniref:hypothetical protein n=1 Tax=Pontibacter pamirensis TaxID=2562824 RepID=UPI001389A983|nr:hypothetical protein [Pontibacter pamirensis]